MASKIVDKMVSGSVVHCFVVQRTGLLKINYVKNNIRIKVKFVAYHLRSLISLKSTLARPNHVSCLMNLAS